MRNDLSPARAIGLGVFVCAALGLASVGVFAIGRHGGLFTHTFTLRAAFPTIGGIQAGTRVRVQGIDAGIVSQIELPAVPGDKVVLNLQMNDEFRGLVRRDAVAQLATQGIVGQRVVEISPGSATAEPAQPGEMILAHPPIEVSQLLSDAQQAGHELRALGNKLAGALDRFEELGGKLGGAFERADRFAARVDGFASRIEQGEGSLGKFVMKDDAHQAALELMRSGDQMMTTLDQTVTAARRVWPLKDYFMNQGMSSPEEVLFRPGSEREVRHFDATEFFKPETSVLTDAGRVKLDAVAEWLNGIKHAKSEIVVAVFDQQEVNMSKAQKLTQEQAAAIRACLVDQHGVNKLGFFSRRQVLAAGFGHLHPEDEKPNLPPQRIEIVVFVPGD